MDQYMLIFLKGACKAGFIEFNGIIDLPGCQVSIRQHDPVIKSIRKAKVVLQPPDPHIMAYKKISDPLTSAPEIPCREHLREDVCNAADDGDEDYQPYPFVLRSFTYTMNSTYCLQADRDEVKIIILKEHGVGQGVRVW